MKGITHALVTLIFAAGLFQAACSPKETAANLTGKTWKLVSYSGKPAITGVDTSLVFGEDGNVNGNVGCNSFSGNYEAAGSEISFDQMLTTMMACEDTIMEQESGVLSALNGTLTFKVDGNTLTLFAADGSSAVVLTIGQ